MSIRKYQAEQRAVSVEAPWPADLDDLDPGFVVTVQELIGDLTRRCLVRQLERFGAEPLHADHRDEVVGQDAAHRDVGLEIFQLHALLRFPVHIRKPSALPEGSTSWAESGRSRLVTIPTTAFLRSGSLECGSIPRRSRPLYPDDVNGIRTPRPSSPSGSDVTSL